ncbi:MAG: TonB-dependent receptor [Sphingomonadales bacterium]|nr:TonB-dependent receptor [Sphingomonadales bacterium]
MSTFPKLAYASVSVLSLASPAYAQQAPAAADGEIIVEARRKDESLQDVPLTVNAVTADSLQKLSIRDMKDITGLVPGLVLNPGTRTTGSLVSLRGLNVDNTSSGNNGTVEFYQNDAPISAGIVLQSMFDVGQIEVLRGPQGTLRGRAAPSGSITVTTKKPDMYKWGGQAQATATSIGGINAQAAVNLPLLPGVFALRVAGLVDDNESNRVHSLNSTLDPSNKSRGVRVSLRATPLDGLELNASYQHLVKNSVVFDQVESANIALGTGQAAGSTIVKAHDRLAVESVPNFNHQGFDSFNWQVQYAAFGQKFNYVGGLNKQDLRSTEPQDKGDYYDNSYPGNGSLSNNNGTYTSFAATMNLQNIAQPSHSYPKQESHEFRLSSDERIAGMFDYTAGFFVNKLTPWTDLVSVRTANFTGSVSPATFNGTVTPTPIARRGRTLERSIFGNLTVHLGDKAEIAGGARHINFHDDINASNAATPFATGAGDVVFNAWIWSASAKYRFNEDVMVYANAGSSWRVGSGTNGLILGRSITVANVVDPFLASLLPTTPERSKSYEIGLRTSWLDRKLTVNVSAFHQTFQNYIFPVAPFYMVDNIGTVAAPVYGNPVVSISNIAAPVPAKVDGFEAEISVRPITGLSLGASIAYANARMSNAVVPCTPAGVSTPPTTAQIHTTGTQQVGQCTVNQKASRIAPFTASLQGEYTRPISEGIDGFARGLLSFYGNSQNDPQNLYDDVRHYALSNLYLGVRAHDGSWEVTAYGKNLFNTFRVTDRSSLAATVGTNLGTKVSNYRVISVTDPREFGVTVRYAFGSR